VFPAKVFSGKFTRDGRDFVIGEIEPIAAAAEPASGGVE
jgi:hypothetical protein